LKALINYLSYFFSHIVIKYPATVALTGTLCGIFACGEYGLIPRLFILPIFLLVLLLPRWRIILFCLFLVASVSSMMLNNYLNHSLLPQMGHAILEAKIIDAACAGRANRWLKNPSLLIVKVIDHKYNNQFWKNSSNKIALQLPRETPRFSYGDIIKIDGTWLKLAETPSVKVIKLTNNGARIAETTRQLASFNFKHYLRTAGIQRCFKVKSIVLLRHENSLFATLMDWRNTLLAATVKKLKGSKQRGMLAALLFGCKQGLPRSSRHAFIYSGTIHIFTVSGLHVGMLAILLLWGLRWVPFSTRHVLVPGLLLLYVASTGMHPPALRAWLMITIFCGCRALILQTPALNIVFVTATLLLLFNPLYLGDAGFQFSFVVVGFLIAASRRINDFLQLFFEKWQWIPTELQRPLTVIRLKWCHLMIASLLGCMVAWLTSSGIALYYQGVYAPAAVMANFLIMPLVWLLFIAVGGRLVAIGFTFIIPLMNGIIGFILNSTVGISEFFYRCFGSIPTARPNIWSLLLFYLSAVGLISGRRRLTIIIAAIGMVGILIFWHSSALFAPPSLFIIHGGESQEPVIIFCNAQQNSATIVNVPSWQAAGIISDCLRDKGITRIKRLIICGSSKKFCSGGFRLLKKVEIEQLVIPASLRSRYARLTVKAAVENDTAVVHPLKTITGQFFSRSDLLFKQNKMDILIDCYNLSNNIKLIISNNGLGTRTITVKSKNRQIYQLKLLNSNKVAIRELVLAKL
jgi:ComEC/Rec2-related protein